MRQWNVITAAALALFLSACGRQTSPTDPSDPSDQTVLPNPEAPEVFQKAFWRAPSAGDEILHAERREWSDAEGVAKWQWFIAVKASPELLKYLRDDNAFGLVPADSALLPDEKPEWFSFNPSEVSVLKSPRGKMQLVFQTEDNTLYATDSGGGLQPAVTAPIAPRQSGQQPSTGRLPATPPPTPDP